MRTTLALAAFVCVLARAELAGACSCGMPQPYISPSTADAPINATVMVWVPSFTGKLDELSFSLRKKSGEQIAIDYKRTGAAAVGVVEMIPRSKLAESTEYEVVMVKGGGMPSVAGSFTTGKRSITSTPELKGFAKTGYYKEKVVCCMCRSGEPFVDLALKEPFEDAKASEYRFAIWAAGPDGKIDYAKPPVTYEAAWNSVTLGHPSICGSANFSFPKQKTLKVGVKLVDLAGHTSAPVEATIDLTKPIDPQK